MFRVDVSDRISDGSSWQLPLTVAHALFKAGRLASPRQAAERAVWLTGQVGDPEDDLSVQAVDHVADKLRQSGAPVRQPEGAVGAGHGLRAACQPRRH